ncbi:MAG TPA: zinc ribbon domain-containing protein, partial [Candidatus Limnocylindrales bacterium]
MTQDQTVLCAKCGFANVPGDQFCGSCGTFLEWEGASAPSAAGPGAAPTPGPGPIASGPAHAGVSVPTTGGPVAGPAGASAEVPAPAAEGLLRCPSCGIANAATRTFCQTCGAKLTPAARVASRSHDEIAAAVAAVPGPKP